MHKTTTEYSLVILTDQYAGNIDSGMMAFLFNVDDDRYHGNAIEARKDYLEQQLNPHACAFDNILTNRSVDEYGLMPYRINDDVKANPKDHYHALEVFIDMSDFEPSEREMYLFESIQMLRDVFGDEIEWEEHSKTKTVKLLGFYVKTYVTTEKLTLNVTQPSDLNLLNLD
ncbi:hypothetical protein EVB91_227 [Rhizobium phage RHph_I1_18]|nr:hypothetical protein EVB91_227 [Rhizobium phage RHph_I1_18]